MSGEQSGYDRRRHKRMNYNFPVQLQQLPQSSSAQIHNSISKDISEAGLQISSFYFYPVEHKMMLDLKLSEDSAPVRSLGRVIWISQIPYQEQYRIGIKFDELNEDCRLNLKRALSDYSPAD